MSFAGVEKRSSRFFYGWIILGAATVTIFLATGVQYSFGVFFKPVLNDFGWDRASLSLAVSTNALLYGALQPLVGKIIDDRGAKGVIAVCSIVMAIGIAAMSLTNSFWVIFVSFGLMGGAGYAGLASVSTSGLVARWFVKRRGMAISITGAGFAAGQLVLIPLAAYFILLYGWRTSALLLGGLLALVLVPLAFFVIRSDPKDIGVLPDGDLSASAESVTAGTERASPSRSAEVVSRTPLKKALKTRSFWMLSAGFFTCGFTTNMVLTHLAMMATDKGFSALSAANSLGIIGAAATVAALVIGTLSDYVGRKKPLAGVYLLRGLSLVFLITAVNDVTSLYVFALLFGLSRAATIPLTTGLIGDIYGRRSIGVIYGLISFGHQIGAATGTYLGGAVFDLTGDYFWAFLTAALLGIAAACASYLIQEKRVREPARSLAVAS